MTIARADSRAVIGVFLVVVVVLYRYRRAFDEEREDEEDEEDADRRLPPHILRAQYKQRRRQHLQASLSRKAPLYDNWRMYSPEDELLSTISRKKADWYLTKGLADRVDDSSIRLRFDPKRSASHPYQQTDKINQCVVCGHTEYYRRYYVVPYCYRRLLPLQYKKHLPHDVLLLCTECHLIADRYTQERRKVLEGDSSEPPEIVDERVSLVQRAAGTLLKHREKMPKQKVIELEGVVQDYWQSKELTDVDLQASLTLVARRPNPNHVPGPQRVVERLDSEQAITQFIHSWRRHFVESNLPRHLPAAWSVGSPVQCDERG